MATQIALICLKRGWQAGKLRIVAYRNTPKQLTNFCLGQIHKHSEICVQVRCERFRAHPEEKAGVVGRRIVKIEKDMHASLSGEFPRLVPRCHSLIPMRYVRPVVVVLV
jgi:hypothetical protein